MEVKFTLGPAPYNWGRERLLEFYTQEVPDLEVDSVYIGDNVCFKRTVLSPKDLEQIVDTLRERGVKVYFSTLALLTNREEFEYVARVYPLFDGLEANMVGFLNLLKRPEIKAQGKELILGPYLNIYNWKSAEFMKRYNPKRLVAAFELPLDSIRDIAEKSGLPVEILGWGHLSTALSWRCYTARAVGRARSDCGCTCLEYPQGMLLKSVEGEDLFKINGLQVLSARIHCLVEYLDKIQQQGIFYLRIYPDLYHTGEIVNTFKNVLENRFDPREGLKYLQSFAPHGFCNGWLWGRPGWEYVAAG